MDLWFWIFGSFLCIVTVTGNGVVIFLIVTRERLHTSTNWLVMSLAVADLVLGLCYLPIYYICGFVLSCNPNIRWVILSLILAVSVSSICALAADRYVAIVKPLRYFSFMTTRRVSLAITVSWTVAILPHMIFLIVWLSSDNKEMRELLGKAFMVLDLLLFELVPCVILLIVTGRMFITARRIYRQTAVVIAQLHFNQRVRGRKAVFTRNRETSSVVVVGTVVLVFVFCYLTEIYLTFCVDLKMCTPPEFLFPSMSLMFIVNSAVNPLVYALLKRDIKMELKKLLGVNVQPQLLMKTQYGL